MSIYPKKMQPQQRLSPTPTTTKFRRKIGLTSGICFVVGTIVGSGIFISPKGVLANANCSFAGAITVWLVCGFFSMLGAVVYSELGTTIPRSGGDYAYLKTGFGSFVAFLYLWLNLIVIQPATQAILALTFAHYLLDALLDKSQCDSWNYDTIARVISALLISFLGYVNCVNVKWAIHLQNGFTVLKVTALAAIIVSAFYFFFFDILKQKSDHSNNNWIDDTSPYYNNECKASYSLSIYSGLFAFGGWNYLNIVTEELKDPYKNLPRAALIGILMCTIIYVLANASYFITLSATEILDSPAIALTFARKLLGPFGTLLITLSISASAVGSLNAAIFTSSRLFCMGAQEKHLPAVIGMLHHDRCTPVASLILSVLLSLVMLLVSDVYTLINYFSFTYWMWTGIVVTSGVYLRRQSPDLDRPIKLPLPVLYLFILLCFLLTTLALENITNALVGFSLMAVGVSVYFALQLVDCVMDGKQQHYMARFEMLMQKMFLIVSTIDSIE